MKQSLLILIFSFFLSCSPDSKSNFNLSNQQNIIGGIELTNQQAISHFTVGIYDKKLKFICTGSLIRENLILTAAHCIESSFSNIVIVFGLDFSSLDNQNSKFLRSATSIHIHPEFQKKSTSDLDLNDIALIQFSGGLPEAYSPIQILTDTSRLQRKTPVTLAGFGASAVEFEEVTSKKDKKFRQQVESGEIVCADQNFSQCYRISYLGTDHLRATDASIEGFTEKEIRLNEAHGHGTCAGDSGGPLLMQIADSYQLVGVTSRGSLFCDGPAVYTNATEYIEWINQYASEQN